MAAIGGTNPNTNETWLKYGDNNETTHVTAKVYTYQFQLVKTDEGNTADGGAIENYNVLSGATFKLYDAETSGKMIKFVKEQEGIYRVALTTEKTNVVEEIEAGAPIIKGLDAKEYWLEETKAPDGFNKLNSRVRVDLTKGDNLVGRNELDAANQIYTPDATTPGGVRVENHAGSMLPSTGGIGTTIFYVLGGILVIGALVLLAVRRRKPSEEK